MKKIGITFFVVIIFIMAVLIGYYVFTLNKIKDENEKLIELSEKGKESEEKILEITNENKIEDVKQVNSSSDKVSPHGILILKKHYKDCKHTINDYSQIPEELVNLTEKDVSEYYKDWELKGFSPNEIVLYKEVNGSCNEHYIVKEKDGFIAIYTVDDNGKEILKEKTKISTEYLTQTDLIKIKDGIRANGREELNAVLEDFE